MAKGAQSIDGKEDGDRIPEVSAAKALAASRTGSYQFKTYTLASAANQALSGVTPDSPNDGDNLFSKFKRAYAVFIKTSVDITIRFNKNDNDVIPVRLADGGVFAEERLEITEIFITGPDGTVVDISLT